MRMTGRHVQSGVSLIEVLISMLILGIGILGAAALQLNALKYTDSSTLNTQASFIAYDMMDRIRANPQGNYALSSIDSAPAANLNVPRDQDLSDFANNIRSIGGASAAGSIAIVDRVVTISISWDDARAANVAGTVQTFTLTSRVVANPVVTP
jgi:type IV pilus assembly protein PilV